MHLKLAILAILDFHYVELLLSEVSKITFWLIECHKTLYYISGFTKLVSTPLYNGKNSLSN